MQRWASPLRASLLLETASRVVRTESASLRSALPPSTRPSRRAAPSHHVALYGRLKLVIAALLSSTNDLHFLTIRLTSDSKHTQARAAGWAHYQLTA